MAERPEALSAGTRLDGMIIERLVAQGPLHAVYRASDPALGRAFAIKEYLPERLCARGADGAVVPLPGQESAFEAGLERFRQQARLAAALDHPGVAETVRLGEGRGTAWVVMRWYEGRALHEALRPDTDPATIRALTLQLMDAVQHLHEHGLVHRDIKPGNVLVREDGSLVLVDFDAVAALGGDGPRLGSDGYAAPELYDDEAAVGPAADVYAAAATLFRCLSGERPPPADQRAAAIAAGEADPLREPKQVLAVDPYGGLGDALAQGLALDLARRPADVASWRKAYEALDWRLQQDAAEEGGDFEPEGGEWLPRILLGALVLALLGIAWFLVSGREVTLPDLPMNETRSPADGESVATAPDRPVTDREREQWRAALEADTVEAYRRFLESWPDSRYREQARIQLDILDDRAWQNLSAEDTLPAYRDYLEQFPEGLHQADALRRIDEIEQARARAERERLERERRDREAWQAALDERTVASMERYLADWPAGAQVEEAQRIRRQLLDRANDEEAWRTATRLDTLDAYQAYLDAFPEGEHVTAALQAMDRNTLRPGKIFRDCERCPELMVLPAGTFRQGSEATARDAMPLEQPARQVTIPRPFAAGMYEVTLAEWDTCVDEGGCKERPADNGWGRGRRPAMMVSWNDAQQYLAWLSKHTGEIYRLPSESEWEYLARAGTRGDWLFDDPALVCEFGNVAGAETDFRWRHPDCADPVALGTLPVGSLRPNDFGLFDVIGNVAEWTADCMNLSYIDAPNDGSAWTRGICSSHMARGGSWVTGTRDIRLAARFHLKNGDRNDFTGFRVVREIDE